MIGDAPGSEPGLILAVSRFSMFLSNLEMGARGEEIAYAVS